MNSFCSGGDTTLGQTRLHSRSELAPRCPFPAGTHPTRRGRARLNRVNTDGTPSSESGARIHPHSGDPHGRHVFYILYPPEKSAARTETVGRMGVTRLNDGH